MRSCQPSATHRLTGLPSLAPTPHAGSGPMTSPRPFTSCAAPRPARASGLTCRFTAWSDAEAMTFPNDPARLLGKLRAANQGRDVHLVGGPRTIETFRALGALIPGSSRPGQLPEGTLP